MGGRWGGEMGGEVGGGVFFFFRMNHGAFASWESFTLLQHSQKTGPWPIPQVLGLKGERDGIIPVVVHHAF